MLIHPSILLSALLCTSLTLGANVRQPRGEEEEIGVDDPVYQSEEHGSISGGGSVKGGGGGGGIFESISGGLSDMGNGIRQKLAPLSPTNLDKKIDGVGPSTTQGLVKKEREHELFSFEGVAKFAKLLLNPFELVRVISSHFKLPLEKFVETLSRGLFLGTETLLHPLVFSVKIVEKVFQPDACRLRFMCRMGAHLDPLREHVLRFSPTFLEGSSHIKSFSDGIIGRDCDALGRECEPRLRKPYEDLKQESSSYSSKKIGV